jgi:glycogen synthase
VRRALEPLHQAGALPAAWRWVIVGDGPDRARLAAALGPLRDHVTLVGRVDEPLLHALYERADVFVHATRFEGSSLVTLEAMAHGLPVVATRAGGIPDKVRDHETGRLVEPGDVAALQAALHAVASDASGRAAMGRRGREHALDHFAWPALVDRTLAVYEQMLAEARG